MKKIYKYIILIIIVAVIICSGITIYFLRCNEEGNSDEAIIEEIVPRAVQIDGIVYVELQENIIDELRCGVFDGKITKQVDRNLMPTQDNESNFGIDYGYQNIGDEGIDIEINGKWYRFTKSVKCIEK